MGHNITPKTTLTGKLSRMKEAFSNYNVVRMREALRYLHGPKLDLFIKIPFLLHINRPQYPGYVPDCPTVQGIYNFTGSGFCKEAMKNEKIAGNILAQADNPGPPAILGLYHIGSLGTFTQSAQSDFDYWVIIDRTLYTEPRYYNLEKKLNHIVKYARDAADQEVTFFIMDQIDIRQDCYAGFNAPETLIAPKLFLKEEFYRTFLMIAGKIPLWTILPVNMQKGGYTRLADRLSRQKELVDLLNDFIDLGKVDPPGPNDIVQGLQWHICKSREDPVKALLKATMILSHTRQATGQNMLLCDQLKQQFSHAGIDDYQCDPYKIVFDRVLAFHETYAPEGLNLIKNAIFFRLCEYPKVRVPEPGSPKKQLLDHYIRSWNLTPAQVKKLVSYTDWPEGEKRLIDTTIVKRLAQMYTEAVQKEMPDYTGLTSTQTRNLKILAHKVKERLNTDAAKIAASSTYLTRQSFEFFIFKQNQAGHWVMLAYPTGAAREIQIHQSRTFLGLVGWMAVNRLYYRNRAHIKVDVRKKLYESRAEAISADVLYLSLQPVSPLSDAGFEAQACWLKVMVLLNCENTDTGVDAMEILAVNSWGEVFENQMRLDTTQDLTHRYKNIAEKINEYPGEDIRLLFYQLSEKRDEEAVYGIKLFLENRFLLNRPDTPQRTRPLLDKL